MIVGRLALGAIVARRLDPPGQGGDDRGGHLVLDREDVLELAVVALGPDVPVGLGIDQLHRDAHAVARLAHAALDHVLHAELRRHLLDPDRAVLVHEGRVARDHEQVAKARERGDDVLGQAVGEELLLGIAAHVDERQDRDRRLVRDRAQRGASAARPRAAPDGRLSVSLVEAHPEHADRPGDVLDALLAQILERDAEPVADLIAHRARDADAARLGELLQARGHVHAIAEDVVVLADHVAEVDADAKADLALRRHVAVAPRHALLDLDRARHGIRDARELDQHAVAGGLDQPPLVLGDRRVDQLETMGLETRERARLIGFHQAAVADHVGGEDGREPAFDRGLVHEPES